MPSVTARGKACAVYALHSFVGQLTELRYERRLDTPPPPASVAETRFGSWATEVGYHDDAALRQT